MDEAYFLIYVLQLRRTPQKKKERIYAIISNVTPQMLHNAWVEAEDQLYIPRATNESHVEVYGT